MTLRITPVPTDDPGVLRLEGRLRAEQVRVLERSAEMGVRVLDLTDPTSADEEGLAALRRLRDRGIEIKNPSHYLILTDQEKARAGGPAMRIFRAAGLSICILGVSEQSLMHHKFAVFDDRVVATGSYNWTQTAERANYENLVLIDDPKMVARITEEFQRLWRSSRD